MTVILVCIEPRGPVGLGDEVEVPDGAIYDTAHFVEKEAAPPPVDDPPSAGE